MAKKTSKPSTSTSLPDEVLTSKIFVVREQKVMLDSDLAKMYGVETKVLKQAVKRNIERFPQDFMFELTIQEFQNLRSQIVTSSWGGSRYKPFAFTEQGVAMLSSVLNSTRAVAVNIQIMRVFVKMRQMASGYKDLLSKIEKLETNDITQDEQIQKIYQLITDLLEPVVRKRNPIGFKTSATKRKR
jgi:hypothetical protein